MATPHLHNNHRSTVAQKALQSQITQSPPLLSRSRAERCPLRSVGVSSSSSPLTSVQGRQSYKQKLRQVQRRVNFLETRTWASCHGLLRTTTHTVQKDMCRWVEGPRSLKIQNRWVRSGQHVTRCEGSRSPVWSVRSWPLRSRTGEAVTSVPALRGFSSLHKCFYRKINVSVPQGSGSLEGNVSCSLPGSYLYAFHISTQTCSHALIKIKKHYFFDHSLTLITVYSVGNNQF